MLNESSNNRSRGSRVPSINSRRNVSTMNRPDSDSLNSNASATVAAQVFKKMQTEERDGNKPAIANGFIPPVVNDLGAPKTEPVKNSPFKAAAKGPIKRPKGITNASAQSDEAEVEEETKAAAPGGPQIAKFMPIPVLEEPKSPFAPIQKKSEPIKRPSSASVNHAQVQAEQDELAKLQAELDALGGVSRKKEEEPVVNNAPLKTKDKTFVPLAPVPYFKQEEQNINPFAAPVQKSEEQIRREEEAARRALENSRVDKKKSKLDKLMDGLNRPIF